LKAQAGRGQRTQGVQDALEKAGLKVVYQEIDDATNANASAGVPVFTGIMSAHPEIKMVITDHGNLTGTIQTFLQAAGKSPVISLPPASISPAMPLPRFKAAGCNW